jgi:magnesium chelatase subunit I
LSQADQNLLYIDEVNLLDRAIIDAILDAAAQGQFTVRRGPVAATYRSRLTLVGSMNPEEGQLRPQIHDRFGLRVLVRGATDVEERLEIYDRAVAYRHKPYKFVLDWALETEAAALEIAEARKRLPKVTFAKGVQAEGLSWIEQLDIDSHRAELTLFEAGRAYAAADDRLEVTIDDLRAVARLALRQRRNNFAAEYYAEQTEEDERVKTVTQKRKRRRTRQNKAKGSTAATSDPSANGRTGDGPPTTEPKVRQQDSDQPE